MTNISGFTFIHNALHGGYPIVEAIYAVLPYVDELLIVDMESTDGTSQVLSRLMENYSGKIRVVPGVWTPGAAGRCLAAAHAMHEECQHEVVLHFEADEVFCRKLLDHVLSYIKAGVAMLNVPRIQVEQNFQRIREYVEYCNRVFVRGTVCKDGRTTDAHNEAVDLDVESGYLWDCTNCFRDHWAGRIEQQAELWGELPQYRYVPRHFLSKGHTVPCVEDFLSEPQWTYRNTPLAIPRVLKGLVGETTYNAYRLLWAFDKPPKIIHDSDEPSFTRY